MAPDTAHDSIGEPRLPAQQELRLRVGGKRGAEGIAAGDELAFPARDRSVGRRE
jgi:hypothetical protein